jgi:hypothetical protein
MAITTGTRRFGGTGTDAISPSHSIATDIASPKIVVILLGEKGTAPVISNVQFNSTAMTLIGTANNSLALRVAAYYLDTSLAAGTYTLSWDHDAAAKYSYTVYQLAGAAAGAPEAWMTDTESAAGTIVGDGADITVTAGAYLMSAYLNSSAAGTVSVSSGVTKGDDDGTFLGRHANAAGLQGSAGAKSVDWTHSTAVGEKMSINVSVAEGASGPTITSVTPSSFDDGRSGIVIAGSGFGAVQDGRALTIGAVTQTVTAWSDTSITFTAVRGSNSMGANSVKFDRG